MDVYGKIEENHITFLALANELDEQEIAAHDWRVLGSAETDEERAQVFSGTWLGGPLFDVQGCANYKLADGAPVERTEAEKAAETAARPAPEPTQLDRVEAQITYTAMMTDTMLEG